MKPRHDGAFRIFGGHEPASLRGGKADTGFRARARAYRKLGHAARVGQLAFRVIVEREGRLYCDEPTCARAVQPFETPKAAKSHPWAAHGVRSNNLESIRRRERRYRAAPPIASPILTEKVEAFLAEFPVIAPVRERLRRDLLACVAIAADAPPPPVVPLPDHPDIPAPTKVYRRALFPGEEEDLRRQLLHLMHAFAARRCLPATAVLDSATALVERRLYRRGLALVRLDPQAGYESSPSGSPALDRLADLFTPGARA